MLQTRRGTLRVVGMAVAVLVMAAGAAGAVNCGTATALAHHKPRTVPFTGTATCAQISQIGYTHVIVCAGTSSIDGDIAAVAKITINGTSGTDTLPNTTPMVLVGSRRPSPFRRMPPA